MQTGDMSWRDLFAAARDAGDIARHARSLPELAEALLPPLKRVVVLGTGDAPRMDADSLIRRLRSARNALKANLDGRVDYRALRESEAFTALTSLAPALAHLRPTDLPTDAERLAFFINLYNVLAIHGVLALGIERSVMEVPAFFSKVAYRVGGELLTLDRIENGVLRRNAGHPATKRPTLPAHSTAHAFAPSKVEHADEPLASALREAFARALPFRFKRYDWSLNAV